MPEQNVVEAELSLVKGMQFLGRTSQSRIGIVLDAKPEHGGQGSGFNPTELILLSLGGCTGMDVISILRKKKQDVTGLEVHLKGLRAPEHPRRYTEIEFLVRGRGISKKAVARSIELSQEKYCSVTASLSARITSSFRIIEESGI